MALHFFIFNSLHSLVGLWGALDRAAIFFAKDAAYFVALAFIIFFFFGIRSSRLRVMFFMESALALIVAVGLLLEGARTLFYFARPFEAMDFTPLISGSYTSSFPSGHATLVFALSALVFPYNRKLGTALFALSALIGAARVFVGVHWPIDIIGGAVLGIGSALLAHRLVPARARTAPLSNN